MVERFFKKWKKDSKFRRNIVITVIIIYFILNFTEFGNRLGPQATIPPQSTCDVFNSGIFTNIDGCLESNCLVNAGDAGFGLIGGALECTIDFLGGLGLECKNDPMGWQFLADSRS